MKARFSPQFEKDYSEASEQIQKAFERKLSFLLKSIRHPSLRAKKYDEVNDIWQARVNGGWRFYFQIRGGTYYLLQIGPHPK